MKSVLSGAGSIFKVVSTAARRRLISGFIQSSPTVFVSRDDPAVVVKNDGDKSLKVFEDWAIAEQWNPGLDDMRAYYSQDNQSMNTLWLNGEPVSMLQSMKYGSNGFGYLGLYRVDPKFRGAGLGVKLWDFSMDRLSDCHGISLNAVLEQVDNYATYGFEPEGLVSRWIVSVEHFAHPKGHIDSSYVLQSSHDISVSEIVAMDYTLSGYKRPELWSTFCRSSNTHVVGFRLKGELVAYAVLLKCIEGYKFSSVFSPDPSLAHHLMSLVFKDLALKRGMVQLDTSDENPLSSELAITCGFRKVFDLRRMTRGDSPDNRSSSVFGLSTVENG